MGTIVRVIPIFLFILIVCNLPVRAESMNSISNQVIFSLLQKAFETQVSLSNDIQSYEEVNDVLSPYFEHQYKTRFLLENLYKEEDGYIVYGSDFAMYYVPYFSYTDDTKVLYDERKNRIYVYEYFKPSKEGPVLHDGYFAIMTLEQNEEVWKISDLMMDKELSEDLIELEEQMVKKQTKIDQRSLFLKPTILQNVDRIEKLSLYRALLMPLTTSYRILEMEY